MRGLSPQQIAGVNILIDQSVALRDFTPAVLEKEVIVKDVVLEVAKVGRDSGFQLVFSGGTSLSQGWGVVDRISEDVDFRVVALNQFSSKNAQKTAMSRLKAELGHALGEAGFEIDGEIVGRDSNRYIHASVLYQSVFPESSATLRPFIKVELMGVDRDFVVSERPVRNVLERYELESDDSGQTVLIVPLPDIVSDKVISYLRRTAEHRANPELSYRYDPRLVRHLYDVHCIVNADASVVEAGVPIFVETLASETEQYGGERFSVFRERPLDVLKQELVLLQSDADARTNYEMFLADFVYGAKSSFNDVIRTFREVASEFLTVVNPKRVKPKRRGFGF